METKIVTSGMRPTGRLHLGNYNSVIKHWIKLQNTYNCFFFIADIHALTTNLNNLIKINYYTKIILSEWLASGINPKKCNIFIQSHIPETFELHTILSMITHVARLERVPSYKSETCLTNKTYGFLGYPILQGADILILNTDYVPIGEDQIPHMELIKELAKKLNNIMQNIKNTQAYVLKEPMPLLYKYTNIIGTDGTKMSKSKNNTILISETSNILESKIKKLITDQKRIFKSIPGTPENCSVWTFHKIYSNTKEKKYINNSCKTASIGCLDCKNILYQNIEKKNIIITKNIKIYEKKEKYINSIIQNGASIARDLAKNTIKNIKTSLNII